MSNLAERLQPFWAADIMYGESALFNGDSIDHELRAPLCFAPLEILTVTSTARGITYREGRDWRLDGNDLVRPVGSTMPALTTSALTPAKGSQAYDLSRRDGSGEILFGACHEYHDVQVEVTYRFQPGQWRGPQPAFAEQQLPNVLTALRERRQLSITVFGDSISTGANASGWAKVAPFQPSYTDLLAERLRLAYGAQVTLGNQSVSGQTSAWGLDHVQAVAETKPDLAILAWGMNDGNAPGTEPDAFSHNLRAQITAIRATSPRTDCILVAGMLPNDEWQSVVPGLLMSYRAELLCLAGPGVAVADVSGVWAELLTRKRHLDLSGNGVNHPNDFAHRIYAQVVSALLIR